jgi:hypothetical protein
MGPLAVSLPPLRSTLWAAAYAPPSAPGPNGAPLAEVAARALARSARGLSLLDAPAWRDAGSAHAATVMLSALLRPAAVPADAEAVLLRDEGLAASALRAALAVPSTRPAALASLDRPAAFAPLVEQPASAATSATRSARARILTAVAPSLVAAWPAIPRASDAPLLRLLAQIDDPGATTVLRAAASAPDPSLRLIATRALAARRVPALSAPSALARVDARASWSERLLAVEAVGRSEDAAATEALIEAARRDPYGWVRRAAVRLLRERTGTSVDAALRDVRDHDPDRALREEALSALRDR